MRPILYLLCGLPGSGKSTLASELEAKVHGIVLNADAWVCELYPNDAEAAARDDRKGRVQDVQLALAERLLGAGMNVIMDHGLSKRAERDDCRARAEAVGAEARLIFLDVPLATLHERVARRNLNLPPGTFHISADELEEWAPRFERPGEDEDSERRS